MAEWSRFPFPSLISETSICCTRLVIGSATVIRFWPLVPVPLALLICVKMSVSDELLSIVTAKAVPSRADVIPQPKNQRVKVVNVVSEQSCARFSPRARTVQHFSQEWRSAARSIFGDLLRRSNGNDFTTIGAGFRAKIDDVIRFRDHA